jgi:hypothetical protein
MTQPVVFRALMANDVTLAKVLDGDDGVGHSE